MRIVALVALAGLITLLAAILTDNTFVSVGVIVLAIVGILLLARDWRSDRQQAVAPVETAEVDEPEVEAETVAIPLSPDMFFPDIANDGPGASSDARAD